MMIKAQVFFFCLLCQLSMAIVTGWLQYLLISLLLSALSGNKGGDAPEGCKANWPAIFSICIGMAFIAKLSFSWLV